MRHARNVFASLMIAVSCASCGEQKAVGAWDTGDDGAADPFAPIRQGTYSVSLTIERDECEPSLKSIVDSVDQWPPEKAPLAIVEGMNGRHFAKPSLYDLRLAGLVPLSIEIGEHDRPQSLKPAQWPSTDFPLVQYATYCTSGSEFEGDYTSSVVVRPIDEGVFEASIARDYSSEVICPDEYFNWPFINRPQGPCSELYTLRFELDRECPLSDERVTCAVIENHEVVAGENLAAYLTNEPDEDEGFCSCRENTSN